MSSAHDDYLQAGVRLFAVSVDTPAQQSAMVDKLELPFPLLSDPDRSRAIEPLGVADPDDPRRLARPAMILVTPDGDEAWRYVSDDFADRLADAKVLVRARELGLPPTSQERPRTVDPAPGDKAMPLDGLPFYLRGARFAALAMGLRHRHLDEAIAEDSKAYVSQMDRYLEVVGELRERRGG